MDDSSHLLICDPAERITFYGNENKSHPSILRLTNPTKNAIHFKVLTTDPVAFCVKPKMGVIEASETIMIKIRLRRNDLEFRSDKPPKFKINMIEDPDRQYDSTLWLKDKLEKGSSLRFICAFADRTVDLKTSANGDTAIENEKYHKEIETRTEYETDSNKDDSSDYGSQNDRHNSDLNHRNRTTIRYQEHEQMEYQNSMNKSVTSLLVIGSLMIGVASVVLLKFFITTDIISLF